MRIIKERRLEVEQVCCGPSINRCRRCRYVAAPDDGRRYTDFRMTGW